MTPFFQLHPDLDELTKNRRFFPRKIFLYDLLFQNFQSMKYSIGRYPSNKVLYIVVGKLKWLLERKDQNKLIEVWVYGWKDLKWKDILSKRKSLFSKLRWSRDHLLEHMGLRSKDVLTNERRSLPDDDYLISLPNLYVLKGGDCHVE